jgi:type I restriction enzyme S subunit
LLLRPNISVIEPGWLLHLLNGAFFRGQIEEHSRGLTTPHIRVQDAPHFLIPLPPINVQRSIVKLLADVHADIRSSQILRRESDTAIDAMLPAILNRAFNGSHSSGLFRVGV